MNVYRDNINKQIINHINNGWLCCNLINITNTQYLTDLGYTVSEGVVYWLYQDYNESSTAQPRE